MKKTMDEQGYSILKNSSSNYSIPQFGLSSISGYASDYISDTDLISILTGISQIKCKDIFRDSNLLDIGRSIETFNLAPQQKKKLWLLFSFCQRVSLSSIPERTEINSSQKAGAFFIEQLKYERVEVFKAMLLDNRCKIISVESISSGTVNEAPVYPRNIIFKALNKNAVNLILAHNHFCTSEPSRQDLDITSRIVNACKAVGIGVADHIVTCNDKYTSFMEKGLL